MKNSPGFSWGISAPFNCIRVLTEKGASWVFIDCTKNPWEPIFYIPDYLFGYLESGLYKDGIGSLLNYGDQPITPLLLREMDETS